MDERAEHLRALLAAHEAADEMEAAHRARMLALLDAAGDPFSRERFEPGHFTASAFVLSPEKDALLLILHGRLGRWLQPGGHVDPGDRDVLAAARREVAEETGLEDVEPVAGRPPLLDLDIHRIPPHPRRAEPAHEHFDVRILLRARRRAFRAGSDAQAARWVPLGDVPGIETDESVLRALRKLTGAGYQ